MNGWQVEPPRRRVWPWVTLSTVLVVGGLLWAGWAWLS